MIPRIYSPHVYSIFRAVTGLLFLFHGLQKIFGMYGGNVGVFPTQRWWAGMLELGLGGLVMVGLFTAVAAFLASGEMAVAYFQSHQPRGFWPIENGGEHCPRSTASRSSSSQVEGLGQVAVEHEALRVAAVRTTDPSD